MKLSPSLANSKAGLLAALGAAVLSTQASAQMADDCANAPLYGGNASIAYDTTSCSDTNAPATTSATGFNTCGEFEHGDVFANWSPFHAGSVTVTTCNSSTFDTLLSVYEDCARTIPVACNDDGLGCFGGTSTLNFTAEVGKSYFVVLSHFNSSDRGTGTVSITHDTPPPVPDTCFEPLNVGGPMTQGYDTTTLTTSGFNGNSGCGVGANSIHQDAFWVWTALADGDWTIDTFGSDFDTKLSVHSGTDCLATCVGYNDDANGTTLQSEVVLTGIQEGDTFLIQAGGFGTSSGNLVVNASFTPDPCAGLTDAYEDNDDCTLASPFGFGDTHLMLTGLNVSKADKDFYEFTVASGATIQIDVLFTNANGDIDAFLRYPSSTECGNGNGADELADGYSSNDNESFSWTNTGPDCEAVILEINVFDSSSNPDCNDYDLLVDNIHACSTYPGATRFCDPMDVNSTGVSTKILVIAASPTELALDARDGPSGQFGYFLVSNSTNEPGISVGSGRLCLGAFGRYNVGSTDINSLCVINAQGALDNLVGTGLFGTVGFVIPSTLPFVGSPQIQAGEVWHFQLWHRENGGDSNFSNGLSVQF